ncbi:MAG: methyltransferase domain-containing protein [Pseudomonadota bacterium]|nr:methyltransferase domain-containing protein [Pseudomonadota bacterium]
MDGHVSGLDFSETMFQAASERNQLWLLEGKMTLRFGSSDVMPFEECMFDKVATANTLYFWQAPQVHLKEVLRVLKPSGQFVMGFRDSTQIEVMKLDRSIFRAYSLNEVETLLIDAGFEEVVIHQQAGFPFTSFVAVAVKP